MSPSDETFSLQELSELTETETRNIRYYISIGLLPAPLSRGRDARYSKLHKQRLEWVKLLREQYKLDEIRQSFQELSDEEIQGLLNNVSVKPPNEAASYLTSVAAAFEASSRGSSHGCGTSKNDLNVSIKHRGSSHGCETLPFP